MMETTDETRKPTETARPMLRCPSCGAEFDATQNICPFCGHVNESADEKGFYQDLQASEQAVRAMVDIPEETATREVRRTGKLIAIVLIVFSALVLVVFALGRLFGVFGSSYSRDEEADYLWLQENLPKLNAAYDEGMATGDFSGLLSLYDSAQEENAPVWRFEHDTFTGLLQSVSGELDEDITHGDRLTADGDRRRYLVNAQLLFYDEMALALIPENPSLSDKERDVLLPLAAPYVDDMKTRFSVSEEDMENFRNDYRTRGYLSYSDCETFVAEKLK